MLGHQDGRLLCTSATNTACCAMRWIYTVSVPLFNMTAGECGIATAVRSNCGSPSKRHSIAAVTCRPPNHRVYTRAKRPTLTPPRSSVEALGRTQVLLSHARPAVRQGGSLDMNEANDAVGSDEVSPRRARRSRQADGWRHRSHDSDHNRPPSGWTPRTHQRATLGTTMTARSTGSSRGTRSKVIQRRKFFFRELTSL